MLAELPIDVTCEAAGHEDPKETIHDSPGHRQHMRVAIQNDIVQRDQNKEGRSECDPRRPIFITEQGVIIVLRKECLETKCDTLIK